MPATFSTANRNTVCDARTARYNGGKLQIYKGASLVVEFTLPNPAFAAAANGVAGANGLPLTDDALVATTGGDTLTAKVINSSGQDEVTGLTVSATGGGGDVQLNNVVLAIGQTVNLTALTNTEPASA